MKDNDSMDNRMDVIRFKQILGTPLTEKELMYLQMDRMDVIRLKQILGSPLTEKELMCLQMEQNGFGCSSCGS